MTNLVVWLSSTGLHVGESVIATTAGFDASGYPAPVGAVSWSSAGPSVASISSTGIIDGLSNGSAAIIAAAKGLASQATAIVSDYSPGQLRITAVPRVLSVGDAVTAVVVQRGISNQDVRISDVAWSSSDTATLLVTASGVVRGMKEGQARVLAVTGGQSLSFVVTLRIPRPAACAPWPTELGDMLARLPLPAGLCLTYDGGAQPSEYSARNRLIVARVDGNIYGVVSSIAHELGHAHQHWAVIAAGFADFDSTRRTGDDGPWLQQMWLQTPEGRAYHKAAGWAFTGFTGNGDNTGCGYWTAPGCWSQALSFCEASFCHTVQASGAGFPNALEEGAQLVSQWYNPTGVSLPTWGSTRLASTAPLRAMWAKAWLP